MCTSQYQTDKLIKKWVEELNRHFFFPQRRHTDGQQVHEKILNITIIREMQIKATMRLSTHTYQNGYRQKASVSEDVKQR